MGLADRVGARVAARPSGRKSYSAPPFWSTGEQISLNLGGLSGPGTGDREYGASDDFMGMAQGVYKGNGLIFQLINARRRIYSQIRFQFREFNTDSSGTRPGKLFGDQSLELLEVPWPNGSTGQLLGHQEVDSSLAGNAYTTVVDPRGKIGKAAMGSPDRFLARMRPDWVTLLIAAPSGNLFNVDARVVGLSYAPPGMRHDPLILTTEEFSHYAPIPDPAARWRGMSWITPVMREIRGDNDAVIFKNAFFTNAATPKLAVKLDANLDDDEFDAFVTKFREVNEGSRNAYRTLFLANGADITPVAYGLRDFDFSGIQGHGEVRLAGAAGIHPSVAGLADSLTGSSLNAGNFGVSRRLVADTTMRDLWSQTAAAFSSLVPPPRKMCQLWYDDRDIPFLREDATDAATILSTQMATIGRGLDSGFDPDAMIKAAMAGDLGLLKGTHSGLFSVQLQPPGTVAAPNDPNAPPDPNAPSANGHGAPAPAITTGGHSGR